MSLTKITGIMAADPRGIIGKNNDIPWNYPNEVEHFRKLTQGHVVVMGRKTFEAIPLLFFEERTPVIFSRHNYKMPACTVVGSTEEFRALQSQWQDQKIFMIGGAEIAHLFLKEELVTDFILTKIHKSYTGDASLDLHLLDHWPEVTLQTTENYTICHLQNPHFYEN